MATASISGDIDGLITLRAYASASYDKNGEVPFGTILVPITGPVPIFLKFDLFGVYSMAFDASVEVTTSFSLNIPIEASVSIVNGEFSQLTKPSFSPLVTFTLPNVVGEGRLSASAGVKLGAGLSLAGLLDVTLNPQAEAVFESSILAEVTLAEGFCSELEWDLYGQVTTNLETELDLKILTVGKAWDTPLNFVVYQDTSPFGSYLFGNCPADGDITYYTDDDGDGYSENDGDCNDSDATIYAGATEVCGDGIDQNCSGTDSACPPGGTGIDLNQGLVAYFPFDGNATDASGNGYDGVVKGTPIYVSGKTNQAISLDGVSDSVEVSSKLPLADFPLSFSAWVNLDGSQTDEQTLYASDDWDHYWGDYRGVSIHMEPDGIVKASFGISGNSSLRSYVTSAGAYTNNTWHQVTVVFENAEDVRIYVDGFDKPTTQYNNTSQTSFTYNTNFLDRIGRANDGQNRHYTAGLIDEVRFYDRVLLETEVQKLAGSNSGKIAFVSNRDGNCFGSA